MADKKYGKTIKIGNRKYRYNYEECVLELIAKFDGEIEVIDSVGLTRKGYEENGKEYAQQWHDEIEEELVYLMKEFK